MVKCPICHQVLEQLTTLHCQQVHGLTKHQVIEQYGKPESMYRVFSMSGNASAVVFSQYDYLNSQQFTERFRSKTRKFHSDR